MSRYVFIALAAMMGVVVGLPQHRYQPYQFSFKAGKQDSAAGSLNGADPINLPTTHEERSPVQNERQVSAVKEIHAIDTLADHTLESGQVNQLWKKAARNLVTIPHLLRWVSSLKAETLMDTILNQQERSPEPQQSIPKAPEQILPEKDNPTLGQSEQNRHIVEKGTKNYATKEPAIVKEELELSQPQAAPKVSNPNKIATKDQRYESEQRHQPEQQHQSEPKQQQQHTQQQYGPNGRVVPSTKPQQEQIALDQSPAGEEQEAKSVKKVAPTRPKPTVETDTNMAVVVAANPQQTEQRPHHEVELAEHGRMHHLPQEGRTEQVWHQDSNRQRQQPIISTLEKTTFGGRKKSFFKLKSNKHGIRKQLQSVKRGKTLIQAPPAPAARQDSVFSFDSFNFPAYSYSISHTPSHTFYTGR